MRIVLVTMTIAIAGCVSSQPGFSNDEVDKLIADERAHCDELIAMEHESLAEARGHAIEPFSPILALEALKSGNTACGECLLQEELDGEIMKADHFLASSPPPAVLKVYQPTIDQLRNYRERHPWVRSACAGACTAKH